MPRCIQDGGFPSEDSVLFVEEICRLWEYCDEY